MWGFLVHMFRVTRGLFIEVHCIYTRSHFHQTISSAAHNLHYYTRQLPWYPLFSSTDTETQNGKISHVMADTDARSRLRATTSFWVSTKRVSLPRFAARQWKSPLALAFAARACCFSFLTSLLHRNSVRQDGTMEEAVWLGR